MYMQSRCYNFIRFVGSNIKKENYDKLKTTNEMNTANAHNLYRA